MFMMDTNQDNRINSVDRVIIRNKDGVVIHDWSRSFFGDVRVVRSQSRIIAVEYESVASQQAYAPSTSDSVEIFS